MNAVHAKPRRLPAALLAEARANMLALPGYYRGRAVSAYYNERRPAAVKALTAAGLSHQAASSRVARELRAEADASVPPLEHFAAGDGDLVAVVAAERLRDAARLARANGVTARREGLRRLRRWGLLRTTIKAAEARRTEREVRRSPSLRERQEAIVRDVVPTWQWPHEDRVAPGLRGLVEVNRNGAVHVWTLYAEEPLAGAGGRFLDSLPRDARVRVFGVTRGGLMEAMLRRRGFQWSRYGWHGLRRGERVSARAWTWLYR